MENEQLESRPVQAGVIYVCKIRLLGFPFVVTDKQKADDWVNEDPENNYYETLTIK